MSGAVRPYDARRVFKGPQRPAKVADVFLASTSAVVLSRISQVVFLGAAIMFGILALNVDDPTNRWLCAAFGVVCLLVALLGFFRIRRNTGRAGAVIAVAVDMNGMWWADRHAVGRITWWRIAGVGFGMVYDSTGGVQSTNPVRATLELFLADDQHAGGELAETSLASKPAPPPGMPARRIRLPLALRDVDAMEQAIGKWAGDKAPPLVGRYSVGVQNTLTGGIG